MGSAVHSFLGRELLVIGSAGGRRSHLCSQKRGLLCCANRSALRQFLVQCFLIPPFLDFKAASKLFISEAIPLKNCTYHGTAQIQNWVSASSNSRDLRAPGSELRAVNPAPKSGDRDVDWWGADHGALQQSVAYFGKPGEWVALLSLKTFDEPTPSLRSPLGPRSQASLNTSVLQCWPLRTTRSTPFNDFSALSGLWSEALKRGA